jgi:hypothetical protein
MAAAPQEMQAQPRTLKQLRKHVKELRVRGPRGDGFDAEFFVGVFFFFLRSFFSICLLVVAAAVRACLLTDAVVSL